MMLLNMIIGLEFQSTPPVQGATFWVERMKADHLFQSTPPVQGATLPM